MATLRQYLEAVPDLDFICGPLLEGTCPCCGAERFTVRLLDLKGTLGIAEGRWLLEPFCFGGRCTRAEIEAAVVPAETDTAKAA